MKTPLACPKDWEYHIVIWKAFLYSEYRRHPSIFKSSNLQFQKTIIDFKVKLFKECKNVFNGTDILEKIITDERNKRLVLILNISKDNSEEILGMCFYMVSEVFGRMNYTSLKSILVDMNYDKVTFSLATWKAIKQQIS